MKRHEKSSALAEHVMGWKRGGTARCYWVSEDGVSRMLCDSWDPLAPSNEQQLFKCLVRAMNRLPRVAIAKNDAWTCALGGSAGPEATATNCDSMAEAVAVACLRACGQEVDA